ncbi:MAG: PilZ domain-containing protein [Bdellovibrionaceae bacterium]|nr:PilZ domain-containing protein [Pseudobdellovibrionaceae bacterium]
MKTEGKVWVIFDAKNDKKTRPLSVVQAQMMILAFKTRDLPHYHIWTPGWNEWIPLSNYLASEQKHFVQAQPPEPVIKKQSNELLKSVKSSLKTDVSEKSTVSGIRRYTEVAPDETPAKVDYGYYYNEFRGDDLTLSGLPDKPNVEIVLSQKDLSSPKDRRANPRHDFKIESILITKKGTSFRSYSRNISLTGTLLEDEIPKDFFNRPFELILINKFEPDPRKNRVHLSGRIIGDLSDPRRLVFVEQSEEVNHKLKKMIDDYSFHQERLRRNGA